MSNSTYPPGSFEAECPDGLYWAWRDLGECIQTTRDKVSIAFGVLSIAAWFMFGFPQMVTNCIKKIPDVAVSKWLLIFWLSGDTLNLIGSLLTNQLFLQKLLAGYTVLIDLILIAQYIFYYFRHKHMVKKYGADYMNDKGSDTSSVKSKSLFTAVLGVFAISAYSLPNLMIQSPDYASFTASGRRLLQVSLRESKQTATTPDPFANFLETPEEKVGYAFGWIACVMYFCSRTPQIIKNHKRKTTEGLSVYLFILAVLGNTFYGLQIFIKSIDAAFVVTSLPWILGSLGILIFDAIILIQFCLYRKNTIESLEVGTDFDDENPQDDIEDKQL